MLKLSLIVIAPAASTIVFGVANTTGSKVIVSSVPTEFELASSQGNRILIPTETAENVEQALIIPAGDEAFAAEAVFGQSVLFNY